MRPADCWLSPLKRLIHLPGASGILAMQIHGCVEMDAWRRFTQTVVNSAPRARAWVACVWRIQWGLTRRSFSAVEGLCSWMTSATYMKNRLVMLHSREDDAVGTILFVAADKWCRGFPEQTRRGQPALNQVAVQCSPRHRRHYRDAHDAILTAIETVLAQGLRTDDLDDAVSTTEMGKAIAQLI